MSNSTVKERSGLEILYEELLEREQVLRQSKDDDRKARLAELTLCIIRVQQLLIPFLVLQSRLHHGILKSSELSDTLNQQ